MGNSDEKRKFVQSILAGDFKACKKQRSESVAEIHMISDDTEWLSYHQVLANDTEDVIEVMVETGKLTTRPSKRLDHDNPLTHNLEPKKRLQYKWVLGGGGGGGVGGGGGEGQGV